MYIATIPNRSSPPAILLREGYREAGKVKTRTLANLSKLPPEAIAVLRQVLKGEKLIKADDTFEAIASRHHGHVQAVLVAMRRLGFAQLIASRPSRQRDLVVVMVAARILEPGSKLGTTRWWSLTTLPTLLGVSDADEEDLYEAMDWLLKRQPLIEKKLAARHLHNDGMAFLCMLSYYVLWHMLQAWRPLLFGDEDQEAKATRDPVAPAKRSAAALRKAHSKALDDGSEVHSFQTLLKLLSGITQNVCRVPGAPPDAPTFDVVTTPSAKQQRALQLLDTIEV